VTFGRRTGTHTALLFSEEMHSSMKNKGRHTPVLTTRDRTTLTSLLETAPRREKQLRLGRREHHPGVLIENEGMAGSVRAAAEREELDYSSASPNC
jgi:hypothetical protein